MPVLSIITINLNNADGLRKTIESVLNQTFTDYEYIIIDGGSTAESVEIIKEFEEKITYWVSEKDYGIYNAMNKGILNSNGEYLLFLNSGDRLSDNKVLSKVFDTSHESDIIYGHMNFITGGLRVLRKAAEENQITLAYFFNNSICHPSSFIARRLFNESLFDESYKIAADKKFFIDRIILKNCTIKKSDVIITDYDTGGITYRPESRKTIRKENSMILSELLPARLLPDIYLLKDNMYDIRTLIKIKRFSILYFIFKVIKRMATLLGKIFRHDAVINRNKNQDLK